jgi:hypothetical protein
MILSWQEKIAALFTFTNRYPHPFRTLTISHDCGSTGCGQWPPALSWWRPTAGPFRRKPVSFMPRQGYTFANDLHVFNSLLSWIKQQLSD